MPQDPEVITRRKFVGSAALAAVTSLAVSQESKTTRSPDHHLPNEQEHGPKNSVLDAENPDSVWAPGTDSGTVPPFKYSFSLARKRIESGGWTRQVTARELPISKTTASVEMRLTAGGVRELHWHVSAEWAIMLYGNARITAIDQEGRSFVSDVGEGDLWLFPQGIPHSIQGLGPDGCRFLLVFDDGNFDEFQTFLLTDRLAHTPKEVLAKNFSCRRRHSKMSRRKNCSRRDRRRSATLRFSPKSDEAEQSDRGGRGQDYRLEEFSGDPDQRRFSQVETRRTPRTALASPCRRVAVLHQRQRTHDDFRGCLPRQNHGLRRRRCWLRSRWPS